MFYSDSLITAESVTSGHPDKICDQISDAILDACLEQDPHSRVAIETFGSHGQLFIGGELTTKAEIDPVAIADEVYKSIGHTETLRSTTAISRQSPDIAQGVDTGGAGDQGIMYGYATNETPDFLPKAVSLAHSLALGLEELRRNHPEFSWLRPDGKTQVTLDKNKVTHVVVSTQHDPNILIESIRDKIKDVLVTPLISDLDDQNIHINPTGIFSIGGFDADTGLTGRKIMVDTYGGIIPHGGGAFSGKDPSKVDRSAAYMCRYVAKNLVAAGAAKRCEVQVAYAIGVAEPVSVMINTFGTSPFADLEIVEAARKVFDFRPNAIIKKLDLRRPVFRQTAAYGHFGRNEEGFTWEKLDSVKKIQKALSISKNHSTVRLPSIKISAA